MIKGLDCKTKCGEGGFGIPVKEIPLVDGASALIQALGDGKADRGAAQVILGPFSLEVKMDAMEGNDTHEPT
ncbi:hypothetical protein [Streptomyces syringium]|uniref:hypothetical protein n=1 Tax=Streptomyces syringium TaxID=76729 RepID=UPI0037D21C12